MRAVQWAWCSFAAVFLGIARGALDEVVEAARSRTLPVVARPLAHLPGIQFKVADIATRLAAAEAHLYAAVRAEHDEVDPLHHYIEMSLMKTAVCRLVHEAVTLAVPA